MFSFNFTLRLLLSVLGASIKYVRKILGNLQFRHPSLPLCPHFQYCLSVKLDDFWSILGADVLSWKPPYLSPQEGEGSLLLRPQLPPLDLFRSVAAIVAVQLRHPLRRGRQVPGRRGQRKVLLRLHLN